MSRLVAFSDSRLKTFESCPKKFCHLNVLKDVKEKQHPAAADGLVIHKALELRVSRGVALPERLARYEPAVASLTGTGGTDRRVFAELKMAVTSAFQPCEWFDKQTYIRAVADLAIIRGTTGIMVDWKSGKEHDDFTQLNLAALMFLWHFPEVEQVAVAFFWLAGNGRLAAAPRPVLRSDVPAMWSEFLPRLKEYQDAHDKDNFPARPSGLCRFCPVKQCTYNRS